MIVCELDKKIVEFQLRWKTLIFLYNLSLFSRGAVGVLFFDHPEKKKFWFGFWWLLVIPKCLVDIWKRMPKKIRALWRVLILVLFGLNEVTFFSNSLFLSSNLSCLINVFALRVPKRPHIVVNRHSLNSRSRKQGNQRFWKMKNGAR